MLKITALFTLSLLFISNAEAMNGEYRSILFHEKKLVNIVQPKNELDTAYYSISEVAVTELDTSFEESLYLGNEKGLGEIIMMANKLLAFGKKVWAIVEAGRPVVTTNLADAISVLPNVNGTDAAWYAMENWSAPKFKKYRVEYKNLFGMTVVGFDYLVQYQYNGSYEGKGKYLTGVAVTASNVDVSWGFQFDAKSSLISISNRGSLNNPMAGATIKIDYTAKSVFKEIKSSETFHITGNGQFSKY